jgi:hypothetical protein
MVTEFEDLVFWYHDKLCLVLVGIRNKGQNQTNNRHYKSHSQCNNDQFRLMFDLIAKIRKISSHPYSYRSMHCGFIIVKRLIFFRTSKIIL